MPFDMGPRLTPAERDRARGRLGRMRAEALAAVLAQLTRQALEAGRAPSPFVYEGPFRASIRAALTLQGWRWAPADDAAVLVVTIALELLQAERPSWEQGQRNYATGDQIARTRCANCGARLEGLQTRFCSAQCSFRYLQRASYWRHADADRVAARAAAIDL